MASIPLNETAWKEMVSKNHLKDNGLVKSLSEYRRLEEDDLEGRAEIVAEVKSLAGALKRNKEVSGVGSAVRYLSDLVATCESEQRDIVKAKAEVEKVARLNAVLQKRKAEGIEEELEDEDGEEEDEGEEGQGKYGEKLLAAFKRLKGEKDVEYHFIICDAKPLVGLMLSKQPISGRHKAELSEVTGGRRFLKPGLCRVEGGKLILEMDEPPAGLAAKIRKSFKQFTGVNIGVRAGDQSDEDADEEQLNMINPDLSAPAEPGSVPGVGESQGQEAEFDPNAPFVIRGAVGRGGANQSVDVKAVQTALNRRMRAGLKVDGICGPLTIAAIGEFQKRLGQAKPDERVDVGRGTARALAAGGAVGPAPAPPQPISPPKLGKPVLAKAPAVWNSTRSILSTNIEELKKGIRNHYGSEHPELLEEIERSMLKLGSVLDRLDDRLARALERANGASTEAARVAELRSAKAILTDYIKYVKSEPLIDHMDSNPFGVSTNLKRVLIDSLTHLAQVIG